MRQFALTGAPGSGKTVLGAALRDRGYEVVAEAATDVIAAQQALGVAEPWTCEGFIEAVTLLQQDRERRGPSTHEQVRFLDRSLLCTLALARYLGRRVPPALAAAAAGALHSGVYEPEVFLVRPLGFIVTTAARRITYAESLAFEAVHEQVYREHGFQLIDVPAGPVGLRTDLIDSIVQAQIPDPPYLR